MQPVDSVGVVQVPIYVHGVGSGEGVTTFSRTFDRILGGAFGWGLYRNVVDAYRHLVFAYEPGDEIYIFGFSRGAFTARSLTGFIRATGIIPRSKLYLLPEAVERYQKKGETHTHPNSDASHKFRLRISSDICTSPVEQSWRRDNNEVVGDLLRIRFLGVWDSVGALGVPRHIPVLRGFGRRRYEFHDADLSSIVSSARHAVALDERRRAYQPTRWENLEELNRDAASDEAPYRELFFVGDHSSIGGGGVATDLSSIALDWIVEGAAAVGLEFNATRVAALQSERNPLGPLSNRKESRNRLLRRLNRLFQKDRDGPRRFADMHDSVYTRWSAEPSQSHPVAYRPGSLRGIDALLVARHRAQSDPDTDPVMV